MLTTLAEFAHKLAVADADGDAWRELVDAPLGHLPPYATAVYLQTRQTGQLRLIHANHWLKGLTDLDGLPGVGVISRVFASGTAHVAADFPPQDPGPLSLAGHGGALEASGSGS